MLSASRERLPPLPYFGDDIDKMRRLGEAYSLDRYGSDQSGSKTYSFNPLGYRGGIFDPSARALVAVFGESHAFGGALDQEESWPSVFADRWASRRGIARSELCVLNLAEGAAPNGAIARAVVTQCARLLPDLVLVHFASFRRIEGFMQGHPLRIGPWIAGRMAQDQRRGVRKGTELRQTLDEWARRARAYQQSRTDTAEVLDTLCNILLVQQFLFARRIPAVATCDDFHDLEAIAGRHPDTLQPLVRQIDPGFLCRETLKQHTTDRAADGAHPGPASNAAFAQSVLEFHSAHEQDRGVG